jgi:hypothetical protein
MASQSSCSSRRYQVTVATAHLSCVNAYVCSLDRLLAVEVARYIGKALNATPGGKYGTSFSARFGKHFMTWTELAFLLGDNWESILLSDALDQPVRLYVHMSQYGLIEVKYNAMTRVRSSAAAFSADSVHD